MTKLGGFVLAIALAACGKGASKGGGGLPADHVAAVNAAIPAAWKGQIEFEATTVAAGKRLSLKAAMPKGWQKGFIPGQFEPIDTDNGASPTLGKTSMIVSKNCDGTCEKKDWAAISDKVLFSQFTSGRVRGKVRKDEKRPNGRTLVYEREPGPMGNLDVAVDVITAWWDPDSPHYLYCHAELGPPMKSLADAFEKACSRIATE